MKKILMTGLAAVLSFTILAACTSPTAPATPGESATPTAPAADEAANMSFYIWDDVQRPAMQAMIDIFATDNPGTTIDITVIPNDQFLTRLQTSAGAGMLPEAFWLTTTFATALVPLGVVQPLSPLIERDGYDLSELNPSIINAYTFDDVLYAIPKDIDTAFIFYNRELFDRAGVPYPHEDWTWDEFRQIARDLTIEGVQYGFTNTPTDRHVYGWILSNGGSIFAPDRMTVTIGEPAAVEAMQFLHDIMFVDQSSPPGYAIIEQTPDALFINGMAAMDLHGSWRIGPVVEALGENLGIARMPRGRAGSIPVSHGIGYATPYQGDNLEIAWRFLQFLGTAEAQIEQVGVVIPANLTVAETWVENFPDHNVDVFIRALEDAPPTIPLALRNTNPTRDVFRSTIQEIWLQTTDVATAMAEAQERMTEEVNR